MKSISAVVLVAMFAGVSAAFGEIDPAKLPPAATQKDITYSKDIKPLFEASCFRCHGEKDKKGGLQLNSLEAVLKGGKEGKVVEAGNALKSQLLISVSQLDPETAMPPKPRARKPGQGGPGGPGGTNAPAGAPGQRPNGPGGPGGPGGKFPQPKPLTPEQVGLVRAWIDQGAK